MAAVIERLIMESMASAILKTVALFVIADTFFGVMRAIKQHSLNSSIGIDGAIRKVSMMASIAFLLILDKFANINAINFIPTEYHSYLPMTIGLAEFFGLLFLAYEAVSILKNMTLAGLPVKGVWQTVSNALGKYTDELPDKD